MSPTLLPFELFMTWLLRDSAARVGVVGYIVLRLDLVDVPGERGLVYDGLRGLVEPWPNECGAFVALFVGFAADFLADFFGLT